MPRTFRLFPAVAFLLILCLAPRADAATGPARFPASFVAAGLLLKPDETPEETLLRAHGRDARAMTLAAVGYTLGVGGFPQEYDLGAAWSRQVYTLGVTDSILTVLIQEQAAQKRGGPLSAEQFGYMAAGCDWARKDPTAPLFQEAGIYNLDTFCAGVEAYKKELPGWEPPYRKMLREAQSFQKEAQALTRLVRELRSRPATAEERNLLFGQTMPPDVWLFFAATDHDPATQAPDWSAERLLAFMDAQFPDKKNETISSGWALSFPAGEALVGALAQNPGDAAMALDLIRRAHAGDTEAMRVMALRYRDGGLGFIRDETMELVWLQRAALEAGDAESMLLLAVEFLHNGGPEQAWAWASLVETARAPDERTKYLAGRLITTIEARYGNEAVGKGRELALFYREQRKAREDRRNEAEQNRSAAPVSDKK